MFLRACAAFFDARQLLLRFAKHPLRRRPETLPHILPAAGHRRCSSLKSSGTRNVVLKFIHAADLHIDSPMRGLDAL